ncbi:MAG: lipopolysaccharide biosynthesis protein [Actinomycetota bacterium]
MCAETAEKGSLAQQASKGALWGMISNIAVSGISFIGTAVLARMLSPRDFGLIGMAVLVTGIVDLFGNFGLGAALVQKSKIDIEDLNTFFWSSIFISILLILLAVILAPFAALFFKEGAVKWIVVFLSFNFFITAFSSVQSTLLYKNIQLKNIAIVEIASRAARVLIMLVCAVIGLSFWSIVIGMIAERILKTLLFCFSIKWKPILLFSKDKFRELFRFGRNIYGEGFLGYLSRNMDFIITGKLLGAILLGFYQFSFNLPYLVQAYVQDGIAPVAFPVFSKVNYDRERVARGMFKAVKFISIIIFPLMVLLSFSADDFITIVYGAKWLLASSPLRLLCVSAAFASVHCIVGTVFTAIGRPEIKFKWGLFRLPFTVLLIVLLSRWGIIGIAAAMLIVECFTVILAYIATKVLEVRFTRYLEVLFPASLCSMLMVTILYGVNYLFVINNYYIRFFVNILLGILVYLSSILLFYKKDFIDILDFARLSFRKT